MQPAAERLHVELGGADLLRGREGTGLERAVLKDGLDYEGRRGALLVDVVGQGGDVGQARRLAALVDAVGHGRGIGVEQGVARAADGEVVRAGGERSGQERAAGRAALLRLREPADAEHGGRVAGVERVADVQAEHRGVRPRAAGGEGDRLGAVETEGVPVHVVALLDPPRDFGGCGLCPRVVGRALCRVDCRLKARDGGLEPGERVVEFAHAGGLLHPLVFLQRADIGRARRFRKKLRPLRP